MPLFKESLITSVKSSIKIFIGSIKILTGMQELLADFFLFNREIEREREKERERERERETERERDREGSVILTK